MDFAFEEKRIEGLLETGWQSFVADDYETALREVETVLLIDGENPLANSLAAACLFRLGRVAEAEPLARNGVRLAPQAALSHVFLAEVLLAGERYEEAESELWEAVAAEPYSANLHIELGRFLLTRGQHTEARNRAERAIELSPENVEAHLLMGYCLGRMQEFEEAERALKRAQKLRPDDDRALAHRGMLCLAQAYLLIKSPEDKADYMRAAYRLERAQEFLSRAVEINPANQGAKENLEAASKAFEQAKKLLDAKPFSDWWAVAGAVTGMCLAFFLSRLLFGGEESVSSTIISSLIAAIPTGLGLALYFARNARRKAADKESRLSLFQAIDRSDAKPRFEVKDDADEKR
ncbi:MAG: tetratricopeptide repeat protein [Blastocatellia bacterium]|nr:tetratricopeptide repeat protein [Blastocatellia bacterium]